MNTKFDIESAMVRASAQAYAFYVKISDGPHIPFEAYKDYHKYIIEHSYLWQSDSESLVIKAYALVGLTSKWYQSYYETQYDEKSVIMSTALSTSFFVYTGAVLATSPDPAFLSLKKEIYEVIQDVLEEKAVAQPSSKNQTKTAEVNPESIWMNPVVD